MHTREVRARVAGADRRHGGHRRCDELLPFRGGEAEADGGTAHGPLGHWRHATSARSKGQGPGPAAAHAARRTAPEARPLCLGPPSGPRGGAAPRGCRGEAALPLWSCAAPESPIPFVSRSQGRHRQRRGAPRSLQGSDDQCLQGAAASLTRPTQPTIVYDPPRAQGAAPSAPCCRCCRRGCCCCGCCRVGPGARCGVRHPRCAPCAPLWQVALSNSLGFALYENFKDVMQVDGRLPPWKRASIAPMHSFD